MLFNSFEFLIFFPMVFALYWLLSFRLQNYMLLVASYFFYGFWDWRFLSLIIISTVVDYISGIKIDQLHESTNAEADKIKKRWLTFSVCTNLGILGFFKYFNFFIGTFTQLIANFGAKPDDFYLNIILPIGISFYTFQTMSYTIDIYRGKMKPTNRFFDFALYVSFFPQLVAGPIERAANLLPRILNKRIFRWDQLFEGLHLIMIGLFKKVYVADNLAPLIDSVFASPNPTAFEVFIGGWGFAVQVYGDFSGYSDIARGCAKCLGIDLMVNFKHPYTAPNPVERWQRWHISLSSWLRDYLYFSLGGNRHGKLKTLRNLSLTMVLGGLWHGAAWNFVLWGAWEGVMLLVHRLTKPLLDRIKITKQYIPAILRRIFWMAVMFQCVSLGLTIFRSQSLSHMWQLMGILAIQEWIVDTSLLWPLAKCIVPLFAYEGIQYAVSKDQWTQITRIPIGIRGIAYGILFYFFAFQGAPAQNFVYFQF
jgi:alginate O-acetyltransferase complex protein AlgI